MAQNSIAVYLFSLCIYNILYNKIIFATCLEHYDKTGVSGPLRKVKNFKCRSYNFEYLKCSFQGDDKRPVQYNLTYRPTSTTNIYPCYLTQTNALYECKSTRNSGEYRPSHELFTFTLRAKYSLREWTQDFDFNNFNNVIPSKPEIMVENITSNSAVVQWNVSILIGANNEVIEYIYKIKLRPRAHTEPWINLDVRKIEEKATLRFLRLDSLYAYTQYEMKVLIKSVTTEDSEEMWSQGETLFQTLAKKPKLSPETDVGSYYVDKDQRVRIFWKQIPWYEMNGPNFTYVVNVNITTNSDRNNSELNTTSYMISYDERREGDYEFTVRSKNQEGLSDSKSVIRLNVPGIHTKREDLQQKIKSTIKDDHYELEWNPRDSGNSEITSYTVFSCRSKISLQNCEDSIKFTRIPSNQTSINFGRQNQTLSFAISFNFVNGSSEQLYEPSISLDFSPIILNEPLESSIKLSWKLNYEQRSIGRKYHLQYCEFDEITNVCKLRSTIHCEDIPIDRSEYTLENLKPYTNYQINMTIFSSIPPQSILTNVTTLEDAPSPPQNLRVCGRSNNSISLEWDSPEFPNGIIKYYEIIYNNLTIAFQNTDNKSDGHICYILQDLKSMTNYSISVIAVTMRKKEKLPGERSNEVDTYTNIGAPGKISSINRTEINSTIFISWSPPSQVSSPIEYELRINNRERFTTPNTSVLFNSLNCNTDDEFRVKIRALLEAPTEIKEYKGCHTANLIQNVTLLYGEWSELYSSYCPFQMNLYDLISLITASIIFLIVCTILIHRKHKNMSDIRIALPAALKDIFEEDISPYKRKNDGDKYEIEPMHRRRQISNEMEFEDYYNSFLNATGDNKLMESSESINSGSFEERIQSVSPEKNELGNVSAPVQHRPLQNLSKSAEPSSTHTIECTQDISTH